VYQKSKIVIRLLLEEVMEKVEFRKSLKMEDNLEVLLVDIVDRT